MIMSVSMFWMSSGAVTPLRLSKTGMPTLAPELPSCSRMTAPADSVAASIWSRMRFDSGTPASPGTGMCASSMVRTSVSRPVIAAAAAMMGLTRCVRPPAPCRPSKLRLEVEAQRSLSPSLSGFMARHMEQPGCRQSMPASIMILSRPSSSACSLTSPEPGTTIAWPTSAGCTFLPLTTEATARMSSMRPLVHEPMKTLSTESESSLLPTLSSRPMYPSARSYAAFRAGSASSSGLGTTSVIAAVCSGEVPHVMVGAMSAASMKTSLSNLAPASVASPRQYSHARAQSGWSALGTIGRPLR
mmetsp:Transcript_55952/g.134095  ORF Transcript_55952/g.134095 Transcript_55952/m.134095 type:complete len:301 (+) Transcript_55952:906-1808(+)